MARIRKKTRTLRVRAFNAKVKSGQSAGAGNLILKSDS